MKSQRKILSRGAATGNISVDVKRTSVLLPQVPLYHNYKPEIKYQNCYLIDQHWC